MYEEILEQMQELLKDEIKNFNGDFSKLEQMVMAMMMSFGKGLLQRVVNSGVNGSQGSSIPCKCDNSMKFVQHRIRYKNSYLLPFLLVKATSELLNESADKSREEIRVSRSR